ncbi:hypothetical protein [Caulobacter sp. 1776]|uniref:hypothetical protein n=1 Tax=Caulobacter sp. 1776 TaxID=3156420 RepID=UPI003397EC82
MNGFYPDEVVATRICKIPDGIGRYYLRNNPDRKWPGYVYGKYLFEKLGAKFRVIDKTAEMLIEDFVYEVDDFYPCGITRVRRIGMAAVAALRSDPLLSGMEYEDEDIWDGGTQHIITMLGMCLAMCQLIEFYISNSFILGLSRRQKEKYETINDLKMGWRRKTLGNMIKSIEEAWVIEPLLRDNIDLFLKNRNLLVHGITTEPRYDIRTRWGQEELVAFLSFFDVHGRILKKAFRSSYYASVMFGIENLSEGKKIPKGAFTRKYRDEAGLFVIFFEPKYDCM